MVDTLNKAMQPQAIIPSAWKYSNPIFSFYSPGARMWPQWGNYEDILGHAHNGAIMGAYLGMPVVNMLNKAMWSLAVGTVQATRYY